MSRGCLVIDAGGSTVRAAWGRRRWRRAGPAAAGTPMARSALVGLLVEHLAELPEDVEIVVGAAGAGAPVPRAELGRQLRALGFIGRIRIAPDVYGPLAALPGGTGILVAAGTGSIVLARGPAGIARAGGRGALVGDPGSGVALGRLVAERIGAWIDRGKPAGAEARAARAAVRALGEPDPESLMVAIARDPERLARLAPLAVTGAGRDAGLARALGAQAAALAESAARAATGAGLRGRAAIRVHGFGGVLAAPRFRTALRRALAARGMRLVGVLDADDACRGLLSLAGAAGGAFAGDARILELPPVLPAPPSEGAHPASAELDLLPARELARLFSASLSDAAEAVRAIEEPLALAIGTAAGCLARGGRIVYVGAGTSGRLGVLDASESPPTFHVEGDRVVGVLAGGPEAAFRSIEGAEDDPAEGARQVEALGVGPDDLVVGVAASGRTPFVRGALEAARARGAPTALVTSNPRAPDRTRVDHFLAPPTGAEVIRGSTRLAAGSAAKGILNALSSGAWVLNGKTYGNYMVDLRQSCAKLEGRARRILAELLPGLDPAAVEAALAGAGGRVKLALAMAGLGASKEEAERKLVAAGGRLRAVLEAGGRG